MVQGIYNVKNGQPIGVIYFGEGGNIGYMPKPQEPDSYMGKTLLTVAAVAGAVIFRKNIGQFVTKHFPKVAEYATKNIITPAKAFMEKHANNSIVKVIKAGLEKTSTWGDDIIKWAKNLKPAAETATKTVEKP